MGKAHIVVPRVILGIALAGIVAAIFAPYLLHLLPERHGSPTTRCISQLKAIGGIMQLYAADCDDHLPLQSWQIATLPYAKSLHLYTCPIIDEEKKKWGYAMNVEAIGRKLWELDGKTVLLFESMH